jgi:hypothetical protein
VRSFTWWSVRHRWWVIGGWVAISRDAKTAFAVVTFDAQANDIPEGAVTTAIAAARGQVPAARRYLALGWTCEAGAVLRLLNQGLQTHERAREQVSTVAQASPLGSRCCYVEIDTWAVQREAVKNPHRVVRRNLYGGHA